MPKKTLAEIAKEIEPPDDGTFIRWLRIWNIRNHFIASFAFWVIVGVVVWWMVR